MILCVHSRYVGAWLVATRESARLAEELIADAIYEQQVPAGQLSLHADRGSSMTSKTVSQLLADLGVEQSHSRPHVSNDNPFSEAQFKPLKYSPTDRKSVVEGKSVSVRVDLGGRRIIKKKQKTSTK